MLRALLTVLRKTILGTLPLSFLAWCGVELLWWSLRRRRPRWEVAGLRFLTLWSVAIFLSAPAERGVWDPLPVVYLSLFTLGILAWLVTVVIRALRRRR